VLPQPLSDTCANGHVIHRINDIPVLLRDATGHQAMLANRMDDAGRGEWYSDHQLAQWEGPFRHHLRRRVAYVSSVLRRYADELGRKPRLLDLGCGDGGNLPWLRDLAGDLYASDYNPVRLSRAAAQRETLASLFMADATDYPAVDGAFDAIFFNHVLEHIPDDMAALREVRRIVRPGGLVVLGVPNEGALFARIAYRLQPETRRTTDHIHFYTGDSIAERCRVAGFHVQEVRYLGYGVPHWSLDARVRANRFVEASLETVGKVLFRRQATSLYLILRPGNEGKP